MVADVDDQLAKISNSWRREIKSDLTAKLTLNLFQFVEGGPLIRVNLAVRSDFISRLQELDILAS